MRKQEVVVQKKSNNNTKYGISVIENIKCVITVVSGGLCISCLNDILLIWLLILRSLNDSFLGF